MVYPQYQLLIPREGEGGGESGGSFWQGIVNYFGGSCDGGGTRSAIPPSVDMTFPEKETNKQGATDKDEKLDKKPAKPFYFVLPPNPDFQYYYPQPQLFRDPTIFPKTIENRQFPRNLNRYNLFGSQVQPRTNEQKDEASVDIKQTSAMPEEKTKN